MKWPEFIITGTPRSGSSFMAELFTSAGYPCGHETFYGMPGYGTYRRPQYGESSWLAVPYLDRDGNRPKVLVLRNPLKVISSLVNDGFFSDESWKTNPYTFYVNLFLPEIKEYQGLDQYLYFWMEWNTQAAHRIKHIWKIEDINSDPGKFFNALGIDVKDDAEFFSNQKENHRGCTEYLTLDDLKDCELRDKFLEVAKSFDYNLI
jgi:hypothetical protein